MRFLYFLFWANLCTPMFSQPILKIGGLPPKDIFIGIDNPVTLDSIQAGQTYELIAEGLTVIQVGNNQWTVRCYNPGTGLLLLKNASGMVLEKNPVTVKRNSEPRIWLKTKDGLLPFKAALPRSVVAELQGLTMTIDIPWLRNGFRIIGFSIAFVRAHETPEEEQIRGDEFPASVRENLRKVQSGDLIHIYDIRCQGIGDCSCTRTLEDFTFRVN